MKDTLMIQGTASDAGKSTIVAGLCRLFRRDGIGVVPFKPQNMALNSAVTTDGGEIGRAQAVQAQAAGLEPHTDMNPVLLKPSSDVGAQVIIHGRALAQMEAEDYHHYKRTAMRAVLDSHSRLLGQYQLVVVEGAGSPAEINLRQGDIANMGFAEAVDCPVILVADIDRGGVFAQIVGTLELLSPSERERIAGFIINRFRGDIKLLEDGLDWLEKRTGKPVLGVLPYLHGLHLEAEDALPQQADSSDAEFRIVVPVLPRISNHTDFDPLRHHPGVRVEFVAPGSEPPPADLVILPGSKNVRADLAWLQRNGWDDYLQHHLRYDGRLIGICGGFQMLGETIHDPQGLEDSPGSSQGLGLIAMQTTLGEEKQLKRVSGRLALDDTPVEGYEIHMGISEGAALSRPAVRFENGDDGVISDDNRIVGTYLHGLFDNREACDALLAWAGLQSGNAIDYREFREREIDRLADSMQQHLDMPRLRTILA